MEWQNIINISVAAVFSVIGWFGRQLWAAVQDLKKDMKDIEVSLPTLYVRKDDLDSRFDRLEVALNRIYDKLDSKVDKK